MATMRAKQWIGLQTPYQPSFVFNFSKYRNECESLTAPSSRITTNCGVIFHQTRSALCLCIKELWLTEDEALFKTEEALRVIKCQCLLYVVCLL